MSTGRAIVLVAAAGVGVSWIITSSADADLPWWLRYTPEAFAANVVGALAVLAAAIVWVPGRGAGARARKLALAVGSCVVAWIAVELPAVVLGHDYRASLGTLGPEEQLGVPLRANRLDPELIHVHHPGSGFRGRVPGNLAPIGAPGPRHAVDLSYDSNGFRNPRDLERADVVVIGDSFVEAALVPLADTLPARIEARTGLVTANLGQAAYGPQQELVVLRRLGIALAPRIVVWCFFGGNDLRDADYYQELVADFESVVEHRETPVAERLFATNAVRRLRLHAKLDGLLENARRRSGLFRAADGPRRVYFSRSEGPWTDETLEVAQATLLEASRLCSESGAELLVVYIPRKFRVYDGFLELEDDSLVRRWVSNDLPEVLGGWCERNGIAFEDATAVLRARAAAGEEVYFADDVHWNGAGHAAATELVLDRARREGWLAAPEEES